MEKKKEVETGDWIILRSRLFSANAKNSQRTSQHFANPIRMMKTYTNGTNEVSKSRWSDSDGILKHANATRTGEQSEACAMFGLVDFRLDFIRSIPIGEMLKSRFGWKVGQTCHHNWKCSWGSAVSSRKRPGREFGKILTLSERTCKSFPCSWNGHTCSIGNLDKRPVRTIMHSGTTFYSTRLNRYKIGTVSNVASNGFQGVEIEQAKVRGDGKLEASNWSHGYALDSWLPLYIR